MKVDGVFDLERLPGKGKENRAGFAGIKVILHIDADMTTQERNDFINEVEESSPVSDNLANVTPVRIEIV